MNFGVIGAVPAFTKRTPFKYQAISYETFDDKTGIFPT